MAKDRKINAHERRKKRAEIMASKEKRWASIQRKKMVKAVYNRYNAYLTLFISFPQVDDVGLNYWCVVGISAENVAKEVDKLELEKKLEGVASTEFNKGLYEDRIEHINSSSIPMAVKSFEDNMVTLVNYALNNYKEAPRKFLPNGLSSMAGALMLEEALRTNSNGSYLNV